MGRLVRPCWCRFCRDCSRPLADPAATADLIAFLQALPDGRKRRGVRYPQWLLLLLAILDSILSGCRSARDLERFAKRHHQAFGAAFDLELPKAPCDSTFLYLFERVEIEELFGLLRQWMLAQIACQNLGDCTALHGRHPTLLTALAASTVDVHGISGDHGGGIASCTRTSRLAGVAVNP